jgi:hypothetical protein
MTKRYKTTSITMTDNPARSGNEADYFFPTCPKCDGTYLHHGAISVYYRGVEDSPLGALSVCDGRTTMVTYDESMDNSPSSRRDGLAIDMECETCGPVGRMTIAQHKGQTLIGWQA